MKLQDVILKAIAQKITWVDAAEIAGLSARTMLRIREKYEAFGYDGLYEQQRRKRLVHRVPLATAEKVLVLYRESYSGMSLRRFHQKLGREYGIRISYSWVRQAVTGAGLAPVQREKTREIQRPVKSTPPVRRRTHFVRAA
jgi:transposase